jgi:branched-chain amino acid transport system substrate-binding protein
VKKPLAALTLLALLLMACGQKPGVHLAVNGGGGGSGTSSGAESFGQTSNDGGGTNNLTTNSSGTNTGNGGSASGSNGSKSGKSGSGGGGGGGGGGTTGSSTTTAGGNTTGITSGSITIGIHAPVTGAAPIEARAFQTGKDVYWNYLSKVKKETVYGRNVRVVFRDDQYNPTTAVAVCDQMASSDKAFLLIGAAGTDQINACSNYANQRGIPYLSAGVQTAGVNTRKTYFAISMTYAAQMPLLAQYICKKGSELDLLGQANSTGQSGPPDGKVFIGMVRPNTPNFNDAASALQSAIAKLTPGSCPGGKTYTFKSYTVVKEGSTSDAQNVGTAMKAEGVDVVSPITAPLFTIQLANYTAGQNYKPRYMGVGITNGINQGIAQECRGDAFKDSVFFSPWPGWSNVMGKEPSGKREYDSDYASAIDYTDGAGQINTVGNGGDLMLAQWGIMKVIHRTLLAAGPNLTRQSFMQTMLTFSTSTAAFPDLAFNNTHFGARNVHVLRGRCTPPEQQPPAHQFIEDSDYPGLRSAF